MVHLYYPVVLQCVGTCFVFRPAKWSNLMGIVLTWVGKTPTSLCIGSIYRYIYYIYIIQSIELIFTKYMQYFQFNMYNIYIWLYYIFIFALCSPVSFFRPTFSHSTRRAFFEESLYSHEDSSGLVHRSNLVLRTRKPGGLTRNNGINTGGGGVLLWKMWGYMWYSISSNVFFSRNLDSFLLTCSTHRVCNIHAYTCFQ